MDSKTKKRKFKGVVVSDKMIKTRVVAVSRLKKHPKYHRYFKITTKFKAHDQNNEYHAGDSVVIEETRPISKEKRWRIVGMAPNSQSGEDNMPEIPGSQLADQ